jgi:hypothetical protein
MLSASGKLCQSVAAAACSTSLCWFKSNTNIKQSPLFTHSPVLNSAAKVPTSTAGPAAISQTFNFKHVSCAATANLYMSTTTTDAAFTRILFCYKDTALTHLRTTVVCKYSCSFSLCDLTTTKYCCNNTATCSMEDVVFCTDPMTQRLIYCPQTVSSDGITPPV